MKLKVELTAEDIALGGYSNYNCPIQRATVRAYPGVAVKVYCDQISINRHCVNFSVEVEQWLRYYDSGRRSEPITFELEVP